MMKTRVLRFAVGLAGLLFVGSSLFAQQAQVTVTKGSPFIQLADAPLAGYVTLFSNLGPQGDAYDDEDGWAISGRDSSYGYHQNVAVAFAPTANSTILGIQVAFEYYGPGTNAGAVAILSDNNGLPGKIIKMWNISNLPKVGRCCKLVTVTDSAGIKVPAGTQVWIALGTDQQSETAYDSWEWTYNDLAQGPYAFQATSSNGKWVLDSGNLPAYAIYGTVQDDTRR